MKKNKQYVFGPVPSRRLGRSLGVDLIPVKTCTFDCIYCQVGRTTNKTIERKEYVPFDEVLLQIKEALNNEVKPDYITLAGSGEPTLYSRLGELIDEIHNITAIPVDILTNGSLFWIDAVLEESLKADLIIPSLDAGDEETFIKINRPHPEITFERLVKGLRNLSQKAKEKVWLEVFIVGGVNDTIEAVRRIAKLVDEFQFTKVQLNTAVRPPAEKFAKMVRKEKLEELAKLFSPLAEIIAEFPKHEVVESSNIHIEDIAETLKRRPCTVDDLSDGLGIVRNEVIKAIELLLRANRVSAEERDNKTYYFVRENNE